ncbi:MAG: L,D-transpeptidase [Deltaproteobacteria bacterium]|nr:L,D-transpeptidase [Deltaproteobacteria bacterium]
MLVRIFIYLFTIIIMNLIGFQALAQSNQMSNETPVAFLDEANAVLEETEVVPPVNIKVNVAARKLYVYEQGELVKSYPVAVGSSRHRTPLKELKLTNIEWNPWWYPPKTSEWAKDAKDTPPGKYNPLGPVKMKLGSAIMFHGTNKPHTVGKAASHGCMRMYSEDAKELAWWLQQRLTSKTDEALLATYQKNSRRTYAVKVEQQIPVELYYDLVEVSDGRLLVYQDVYYKVADKIKVIQEEMALAGENIDRYDWNLVKEEIKKAKNRKDLVFDLKALAKGIVTDGLEKEQDVAMQDIPAPVN